MLIDSTILKEAEINFEDQIIEIDHVSIDSRSLQNGSNTLFFCLKGNNNDGHQFIPQLVSRGVRYFIVEKIPLGIEANFFLVENSLDSLQKLAKIYKRQFRLETIGITGSAGKTIVKEWLNFLLSPLYNIVRSPRSFNSQVGVPLSIFGINENHNLGIFEAGISKKGEMQKLEPIIQPNIGIFTSIGDSHQENFLTLEEKLQEKLILFQNSDVVILEKNDWIIQKIPCQTFTWSISDKKADVYCTFSNREFHVTYQSKSFRIEFPFDDKISIENAISCLTVMLYLNVPQEIICDRIKELYPIELRLQVKKGINNCDLIDDSYSSDYQSLKIALDFFEQQNKLSKKTIILSDIFQSGLSEEQLYKNVQRTIANSQIDRIITIGETIGHYFQNNKNVISFKTTQDFLQQFNTQSFVNESILIKGARNFSFDEIVVLLEEKTHETKLEINLDAITYNYNFYKSKLTPSTKMMVMIKAFGYGAGNTEIAKHLEFLKVDYLGVAFADEGVELRNAGILTPIMVLNPETSSFSTIIAFQLEPEIYSLTGLQNFLKIAKQKNLKDYPIHIKIDTGMHRLGFEEKDIESLILLLRNNNFVKIHSIFSHLAVSDDLTHKEFTLRQISLFQKLSELLIQELSIEPIRHILNTSGIFNYSQYSFDMVRLGLGLYGIGNSQQETDKLELVSVLKSVISQIREVQENESVGYNRKFYAKSAIRVATIPVGYADGISRGWGNEKGYVLIHNQKAPIIGNICMDMLMVDVTHVSCQEGDEVIIIGKNPSFTEIAEVCHTISYEIMTGISQRVKRIYYKN